MKLHEQIIKELQTNHKAREAIDSVEHGEVKFPVQDGKLMRWKAENGGHAEINQKKCWVNVKKTDQ